MSTRAQEPQQKKVMVVDDEENLLITLSDFLSFEGYDVSVARSAEEALEKLDHVVPDIIVLDMRMPGMGGEEFLKRIVGRGTRPPCRVLVLTARYLARDAVEALHADAFLPKPCDLADVSETIGRILAAGADGG